MAKRRPWVSQPCDLFTRWSSCGGVRIVSSYSHALFEVELAAGTAREHRTKDVRYEALAYADDGSLLVLSDWESDFLFVGRLDIQTGAIAPVITAAWDINQMALSPDERLLAYVVNVGRHQSCACARSSDSCRPYRVPGRRCGWSCGVARWAACVVTG